MTDFVLVCLLNISCINVKINLIEALKILHKVLRKGYFILTSCNITDYQQQSSLRVSYCF